MLKGMIDRRSRRRLVLTLVFCLGGPLFLSGPAWAQEGANTLDLEFNLGDADMAWQGLRQILELNPVGSTVEETQYVMAQIFFERGEYYQASQILWELSKNPNEDPYMRASVLLRLGECYFNSELYDQAYAVFLRLSKSPLNTLSSEALYGMALSALGMDKKGLALQHWQEMIQRAPTYQDLPDRVFGQGLIFFRNDQLVKAQEFFNKYPNDPRNLFFSGLVRRSLGDTAGALVTFQNVIKKFDQTAWVTRAQFETAETYYQAGDTPLALRGFEAVATAPRQPLWVDTNFREACAEFQNKHYAQVIELLEPLLNEAPDHRLAPAERHILVEAYVQRNRLDDVINLCSRRGPTEKRTPDENYALVWVLAAKGEYERSIGLAEESIKHFYDPELTPKLLLIEGFAYQKMGRFADAVTSLQLVVDRYPTSEVAARALLLMALAYHRAGDYQSVVTLVNRQWGALPAEIRDKARETEFWIAEAYMGTQNYKEARARYEKFTSLGLDNPMTPYAYFGLATAESQLGESERARATLKEFQELALEKKPDLAPLATLQLGHLYFNDKAYDRAISAYREFRAKNPKDPKVPGVLFQEATALYRGEYFSDASKTWRLLAKDYPRSPLAPQALFQSAKMEFDMGHYAEAVADYRKLIDEYSTSPLIPDARLQIGNCDYNAGNYAAAVAAYNDFIKKYPTDDRVPNAQSYVQTSYYRMKKTPEEIEKLTAGQVKSGVLADMYWENGAKAYNAKDYVKAQQYFQKILLDFPSSSAAPRAYFYRAESLYSTGKLDEAARAYKTFVEGYPNDEQVPMAMFRLGVAYFDMKSYPEAAQAFQKFVKAYPDDPMAKNAALNVPLCYLKSNQWDKAVSAYQDLAASAKDAVTQASALFQAGLVKQKMGQDLEAAQAFLRVPAGAAEYPEALYSAGMSYERLQDGVNETRVMERLASVEPKDNPYRIAGVLKRAEIYEGAGNKAKALALYQDAAGHSKDQAALALAQKKIQELGGK
jgi:TolA-binding protein